jgi:hypothetical protein
MANYERKPTKKPIYIQDWLKKDPIINMKIVTIFFSTPIELTQSIGYNLREREIAHIPYTPHRPRDEAPK